MARYSIEDTTLTNIANAIRNKTGNAESMQVADFAEEISGISVGGGSGENLDTVLAEQASLLSELQTALEGKAITGGGNSGGDTEITLQEKTVTPTKSSQTVTPDSTYDGLSKVTVNAIPSEYIVPTGTKTITTNGTHDVTSNASVNVNVAKDIKLQNKTVTPSTEKQTITAADTYDGLGTVTVNAMKTATQATPTITVSSSGLITAKSTQSAGYVASGTKSATQQLTKQAAKTITPNKEVQTAVAAGCYTTGEVKVAAIPDTYIQPEGVKTITENGLYDVAEYEQVSIGVVEAGEGKSRLGESIDGSISVLTADDFKGVTSIRSNAFSNCSALTSISIPNTITNIGSGAFSNCTGVTDVYFNAVFERPQDTMSYFNNIGKNTSGCSVIIGRDVQEIPNSSFKQTSYRSSGKLISLTFETGSECRYIHSESFSNTNIKTISIPDSVQIIESSSFQYCDALESVIIGTGIRELDYHLNASYFAPSFGGCSNLSTLTIKAITPPKIRARLSKLSNLTVIYVPAQSVDTYKSATNWSECADIIQPIPTES